MSKISRVDVGTPPTQWTNNFEGWTTINVCFHGFANLSTTRDERVESPAFSCFGHQWTLNLYPGGEVNSPVGYAAVALANASDTSIKMQNGYSVIEMQTVKRWCITKQIQLSLLLMMMRVRMPGSSTTLLNDQHSWIY